MTRSISTLLAACATSLAAYAGVTFPIDGVVIDSSTNTPLPNAFVISKTTRYGADPVGGRTSCLHVAVVQADANGRFHINDAGPPGVGNIDRVVFGYKAGYQWHLDKSNRGDVVTMKPFSGTPTERLETFRTFHSLRTCGGGENLIDALRPLYVSIDKERSELANQVPAERNMRSFVQGLDDLSRTIEEERLFDSQKKDIKR
jgi:hypothetical protein